MNAHAVSTEARITGAATAPAVPSYPGSVARAEAERVRLAAVVLAVGMLALIASSARPWGATTAWGITLLFTGVIASYVVLRRDRLATHLLLATLIAGALELVTDWYLIVAVPTLAYAQEGPFVASSPLYMPLSWTCVLWSMGVVTQWIDRRWGLAAAMLGGLVIGAFNLPVYEHLARGAGWWSYHDTRLLGYAPLYLVVGEPLIIASMPLVGRLVEKRALAGALGAGVLLGGWIFVAVYIGLAVAR